MSAKCESWCRSSKGAHCRWCKCSRCSWCNSKSMPSCTSQQLMRTTLAGLWQPSEPRSRCAPHCASRCATSRMASNRALQFLPHHCQLYRASPALLSGRFLFAGDSLMRYQFDELIAWLRRVGTPMQCNTAIQPTWNGRSGAIQELIASDTYERPPVDCVGHGGLLVMMARRLNLLPPPGVDAAGFLSTLFAPASSSGVVVLNAGLWYGMLARRPSFIAERLRFSPRPAGAPRRRRSKQEQAASLVAAWRLFNESVHFLVEETCTQQAKLCSWGRLPAKLCSWGRLPTKLCIW
jgi:hypothetical protein